MKTKKSKTIWIVLGAIVLVIAALSIVNCINTRTSVDYSEFYSVVKVASDDADGIVGISELEENAKTFKNLLTKYNYTGVKIDNVIVDGYVVDFDVVLYNSEGRAGASLSYTTIFGRNDTSLLALEEALNKAGSSFTFTDPNAGSIWSSLLPIIGCVVIAVVFFIIMMNTQGGTKSAMNFAKTNARLNQNLKVRFTDVAGAEE